MSVKDRVHWDMIAALFAIEALIALSVGLSIQKVVYPLTVEYTDPLPFFEPMLFWYGALAGAIIVVATIHVARRIGTSIFIEPAEKTNKEEA